MKKIINYEKDIQFKTNIGEICSISLEHDFTLDDNLLKGEFILSGEYKTNELCVNKENFLYRLPLEYELDSNVDLSSLTYDIDNFEYDIDNDSLNVIIDFGIRYDEIKEEPIIPKIDENTINEEEDLPRAIEDTLKIEIPESIDNLKTEEKEIIMDVKSEKDNYITYHVHIVKEGESLESIAELYNSRIDLIKEYNNIESLEVKDKLIIPSEDDE